ncbi:hypothetical protein SAMN02982985_02019 [Rugamonas rubra]|uniref:Uncharacterized protein n=1 Tax=Rugamonas rubra TaxID=758825 RepID=A0A1I4LLF4_9BURK|nr:hypothetical protein SAMN02982985_02019 [Rugamonas rubra]
MNQAVLNNEVCRLLGILMVIRQRTKLLKNSRERDPCRLRLPMLQIEADSEFSNNNRARHDRGLGVSKNLSPQVFIPPFQVDNRIRVQQKSHFLCARIIRNASSRRCRVWMSISSINSKNALEKTGLNGAGRTTSGCSEESLSAGSDLLTSPFRGEIRSFILRALIFIGMVLTSMATGSLTLRRPPAFFNRQYRRAIRTACHAIQTRHLIEPRQTASQSAKPSSPISPSSCQQDKTAAFHFPHL